MNAQTNFDNNTGLPAGIKRQKWYNDNRVGQLTRYNYIHGLIIIFIAAANGD